MTDPRQPGRRRAGRRATLVAEGVGAPAWPDALQSSRGQASLRPAPQGAPRGTRGLAGPGRVRDRDLELVPVARRAGALGYLDQPPDAPGRLLRGRPRRPVGRHPGRAPRRDAGRAPRRPCRLPLARRGHRHVRLRGGPVVGDLPGPVRPRARRRDHRRRRARRRELHVRHRGRVPVRPRRARARRPRGRRRRGVPQPRSLHGHERRARAQPAHRGRRARRGVRGLGGGDRRAPAPAPKRAARRKKPAGAASVRRARTPGRAT